MTTDTTVIDFVAARPGEGATTLAVEITCRRCGGPVRLVTSDRPNPRGDRTRKAAVTCHRDGGRCWKGLVTIELSDHHLPNDLPKGAR